MTESMESTTHPLPESPRLYRPEEHEHFFRYLGHEIRFTPDTPEAGKLRVITRPEWLPQYHRLLFGNLFPEDVDVKPFDVEAITATQSTELSPQEKEARRIFEEHFGFITPKRKTDRGEKPGPEDVWALGVAFTNEARSITTLLNNLPGFRRLALIGQTDPRLRSVEDHRPTDPRLTISRADHSKDLALMVARTNFTMAMKTPELYVERVKADLKRYEKIHALLHGTEDGTIEFRIHSDSKHAVERALAAVKDMPEARRGTLREALEYAVEYGKYQLVAAYLHDVRTPAWGDIFMKAKADRVGQKSVTYSEDATLGERIAQTMHQDRSGLPHVTHRFSLDPTLLATIIQSMASEGDPCLPGELMKAKRKYPDEIMSLFPHLSALRRHPVYDHDQRSGTKTNAENVVRKYLPGGFVQMRRTSDTQPPIGSFEERARLLMHVIAAGATKEDVTSACIQLGLDPKRVYIAAEEIDFGPNLELRAVDIPYHNPDTDRDELRREVLPVATRPGDVKKAMLMFNILTMEEYLGPQRAAGEELLQNMITSALWGEAVEGQRFITDDDFIHGTDASLADKLDSVAPAIPWVLENLMEKGKIITEEELHALAASQGNTLNGVLMKECRMDRLPQWKEGTLVLADPVDGKEQIKPYIDVIQRKKGEEGGTHPLSFPARLSDVAVALSSNRLFYLIDLDPARRKELEEIISPNTPTWRSMRRALLTWTEPLIVNHRKITNSLFTTFAKDGYDVNEPLLKKRSH